MKKLLALLLALVMVVTVCPLSFADFDDDYDDFDDFDDRYEAVERDEIDVLVTDANGKPIVGVQVQLCNETTCFVETTESDGVADFDDLRAGEYEARILKTPAAYAATDEAQKVSAGSKATFVLNAANATATAETAKGNSKKSYPTPEKTYASLKDINFADYKLIVVNYWEPWCTWCVEEMPDLEKLWNEYKDEGLLIVGMYSVEQDAQKIIDECGITYPTIQYTDYIRYTEEGWPATVFYNPDGTQIHADVNDYLGVVTRTVNQLLTMLESGELDKYADDDILETRAELERIKGDEAKIEAYCLAEAADEADDDDGIFVGYADYETWKERIENHLK